MIDRQLLRRQLPKGYCTLIAKDAGVTAGAVSLYFANKFNSEKIENAALKTLATLKKQKDELIKAAL